MNVKISYVREVIKLIKNGKLDIALQKVSNASFPVDMIDYKVSGFPIVYWAILARENELLIELLKRGADPNITFQDGFTPIYVAAGEDNTEAIEILMRFGANPEVVNPADGGATILHVACSYNYYDLAVFLIKNTKLHMLLEDSEGNSCLAFAKDACAEEIIAFWNKNKR